MQDFMMDFAAETSCCVRGGNGFVKPCMTKIELFDLVRIAYCLIVLKRGQMYFFICNFLHACVLQFSQKGSFRVLNLTIMH